MNISIQIYATKTESRKDAALAFYLTFSLVWKDENSITGDNKKTKSFPPNDRINPL